MLKDIFCKIKKLFKNNNKREVKNEKTITSFNDFSLPWFLINIPPIIANKNDFDKFINIADFIRKHKQEDILKEIVKLNNVQIGLILDLINTTLETFLRYEQNIIHSISIMIEKNCECLSEDTKNAFVEYSMNRYNIMMETLNTYRNLSILLFINRKEEN